MFFFEYTSRYNLCWPRKSTKWYDDNDFHYSVCEIKYIYLQEYYNDPEETAQAFTEDGYFKTGDLLYKDENNNYFYVDRLKALIKYRNYHVSNF